ncbi:lipopolysaccharide export system protein LptA [Alphaproteobacteria bacterium]
MLFYHFFKKLLFFAFSTAVCGSSSMAFAIQADLHLGIINIQANKMVIYYDKNIAIFQGNVLVKNGKAHLNCNELTVSYDDISQNLNFTHKRSNIGNLKSDYYHLPRIEYVIARGNVTLELNDIFAASKEMHYHPKEMILRLQGEGIIKQKDNVIRGSVITYDVSKKEIKASDVSADISIKTP